MERQVIFRETAQALAGDVNNIQVFTDEMFQHMVLDAITGERQYTGLVVTQKSATEIDISAGRLWAGDEGRIYRKDQAETVSIFSHLPLVDQRWLTVSVVGRENDIDIQPRDFLIDSQTGQVQPEAVPMERARQIMVHITPGLESAGPQKPEPPTGYTVIAHVRLNASGVQELILAENKKLMRLFEVYQACLEHGQWIALTAPKITSLLSDMANLANRIGSGTNSLILKLAADVALIKDAANLPATYQAYAADNFLNSDSSDTDDPTYYALVEEGIRPPWAGQTSQALNLFNPYEEAVQNFGGFILPAHSVVARLKTSGYVGGLSLSQYQYTSHTLRQLTRTRVRTRYSNTRRVCTNGTHWAEETGAKIVEEVFEGTVPAGLTIGRTASTISLSVLSTVPGHVVSRVQDCWTDVWEEDYWVVDSTEQTINGTQVAQTLLNSQNGWACEVGLTFDKVGPDGVVYLSLCETDKGLPDLQRCLGTTSLEPVHITEGAETTFEFPEPIYLAAGKRYALVIVTGGDHSVSLVEGTEYSQGTLFYTTDGAYFQGDFTRDLLMTLYFAKFNNPRTVVNLAPISVSDGMAAFDLLTECIIPESTHLFFEYQPSGTGAWYPVEAGTAGHLLGLPAMCALRAVFDGSQDLMPGLSLGSSRINGLRAATRFLHLSTPRTLSSASDDIDVVLVLENFDETSHDCTVTLKNGATEYTADTVTDEIIGDRSIRRTANFRPAAGTGITNYQIQIEGDLSSALDCFHVARRMDVAK